MIDYCVFCSSQDRLRTETHNLDHHVLVSAENTDTFLLLFPIIFLSCFFFLFLKLFTV
jgi:hypothetical protein